MVKVILSIKLELKVQQVGKALNPSMNPTALVLGNDLVAFTMP